jgi:hypothetical protein
MVGDDGAGGRDALGARELGKLRVVETDRGPVDGFLEEDPEEGSVVVRGGGCCRIRLRPEAPRPCSCSVMMGDLMEELKSAPTTIRSHQAPETGGPREGGCHARLPRRPRRVAATPTNLDMGSCSAAAQPGSKENRTLALSVPWRACAKRFPVLRFLGM